MTRSRLIRETALSLRKQGYSYTYISTKTGISKGTLSAWLSTVKYSPNSEMLQKMGKARAASGLAKHKLKLRSLDEAYGQAKIDIGDLSKRDIFMLGIGLYIGEGAKTHDIIRIVNADPKVIKFAIKWFKEACGLKPKNFRVRLHLYPDSNAQQSIDFWSKATALPKSQFQKSQIDYRLDKRLIKKGKLPFGTAHLSIKSHGEKAFGVFLARRINGWIKEVLR